ncbi:MAG: translocation/assembly module TamB domain-containing protein [Bacteroidaceae bacterium]|nr:translocation/assembly module TamB domain-containing protein [Bacteroidaceae bacterium]
MKRFFKWAGIVLAVPVALFLLLTFLLYLPPVQDYAVRTAEAYISEQTGLDVTLERLRLRPLLDLDLQGLSAVDLEGDTLLAATQAIVDLDMTDILQGRIGLDAVTLNEALVNSKDMIASTLIHGRLASFTLHDDVDLKREHVQLRSVEATGLDLDIALRDTTVEEDSSQTVIHWIIDVERANVRDARLRFATAGDSLAVTTALTLFSAEKGHVDLGQELYQVKRAHLAADTLTIAQSDADTLAFGTVSVGLNDITFDGKGSHLSLPSVDVKTATSKFNAAVDMDFRALEAGQNGGLHIRVDTDVSKQDILRAAGKMLPDAFAKAYPEELTHLSLTADGNIDHLSLTELEATLPGSLYLDAKGELDNLLDTAMLTASVDFNLQTKDLNWIRLMADGALDDIRLPEMHLGGTATASGTTYGIDALLREASGLLGIKGTVDTQSDMSYDATLSAQHLNVRHFMPKGDIGQVSMTAKVKGHGTDVFARHTRLDIQARVKQFHFQEYDLADMDLTGHVANGRGHVNAIVDNAMMALMADIDALLAKETDVVFGLEVSQLDLQALGLVETPMKTSMCLHMDGATDLKSRHQLTGFVSDIYVETADSLLHPEDIELNALLETDTTHVYLNSGDLLITANGRTGYTNLLDQLNHFLDELKRQSEERHFDTQALAQRLPQIDLHLQSGRNNSFRHSLKAIGYDYGDIRLDFNLDPLTGMNGRGYIHHINTGAVLLDTVNMHVYQDSTGVKMDARIRNGRRNPQFTFDARLNAYMLPAGAGANLIYYDERGRKGIELGLLAALEEDGLRLHLDPLDPIIAYRTFHLNKDNYLMLGKGNRVEADIDLLADDGTGLKFYSTPNEEALQDLSVSVNHLNLGELMSVLPYAPRMTGFMHGDAHLIQTSEHLSVSTDMEVEGMTYEGAPLGQLGLQAVYLPNADGSHFIDGSLLQTGMPVASFTGTYTPTENDGKLDINATLDRLPFSLANGFIPSGMARLEGVSIGELHLGGTTSRPVVNGMMATNGLRLISDLYSLNLRFLDDTIYVRNSDLQFDRIEVYSTGKNPFVLDGGVNFYDLSRVRVNANMAATNYELINARKTQKSLAYGKVFVDFSAMLQGTLDNLRMFGRLNILGNTDLTYVLTDSPLSVEDQLAELVEFVDFEDSTRVMKEESSSIQNLNITMNVHIDDAAQVHCILSPDRSSYVDIEGGGDLMMTYSPEKDLQLNGRYTVNSGTLKYTMMVIPLKEFSIKSGSYVEFRGPLLNPSLNLSATEQVRTTVTENNQPRSVNFDVGMNITQTLENLGLEFTLEAPEDMSIQNELATMSTEQRGRLAVTMLATGMYITDSRSGTGGGFTGQNALNALLQSQISNITGKALKSIDLSVGMGQGVSATGTTTTDYSFRFAKRFWGNRVSVIVGGKVSTGEDARNTGESIIDNVSIEYRLDKSATRYVNLFYNKNYESVLDGEVTEMGAGLVLRRKTNRLGELFLFKNKK